MLTNTLFNSRKILHFLMNNIKFNFKAMSALLYFDFIKSLINILKSDGILYISLYFNFEMQIGTDYSFILLFYVCEQSNLFLLKLNRL